MEIAIDARQQLPTRGVCWALALAPASLYRHMASAARASSFQSPPKAPPERPHHRALSPLERSAVLDLLHAGHHAGMAPAAIHATLLDQGRYLCSPRTMYRILKANGEVRERRAQATHPRRTPPELVATAPNQVWTWDITHLRTAARGQTLKPYVCMDLFSRYVLGWYLSASESAAEARHFFQSLARRERIDASKLVLHADNGGPMRGRPLAGLLESLGIERSHSRPRTSNDNPFSEAQFKTMKYRPAYPRHFTSEAEARHWCREFFNWYNNDHRHEGIAMLTPADVHAGRTDHVLAARAQTLATAYRQNPQRFVKGAPRPKQPPKEVAINPPPKPPQPEERTGAKQHQEVTK
jgi:putative transposase